MPIANSLRRSVVISVLGLAALPQAQASGLTPAQGAGIAVDGLTADWNLATDLVSDLFAAGRRDNGWPGYAVLGQLYLRYDCDTHTLSALLLDVDGDGHCVSADGAAAWLADGTAGLLADGAGNAGSFAWVHAVRGDASTAVVGYEASFVLAEGTLTDFEARLPMADGFASTGSEGFSASVLDSYVDSLDGANTKVKVGYPYAGGPALFPTLELDLDGNGSVDYLSEGWCIDTDHNINENNWYCADLVSSYNYPNGLDDTRWQNLDAVNWLLNQDFVGQSAGPLGTYTYGDVQKAIWALLENNDNNNGLNSWSQHRVNQLVALAGQAVALNNPAVGYEPPCDGVVGLVIVPRNCGNGAQSQIVIAQILVSQVPMLCGEWTTSLTLACEPREVEASEQPVGVELAPACPNPFNPATTLTVTLGETGAASLKVYDMAGRQVALLFDGMAEAGVRSVRFDASALPSGLYVAVLESARGVSSQKLLLVK